MKKLWKTSPAIIRWILVTMLFLMLTAGGVYAYIALTATGQITVQECLSFVGGNTFSLTIYPQQTKTAQVTIANASPINMEVDLSYIVVPDPGTKGLTVTIPKKITVPASGQLAVTITVSASKSVEPGVYDVSINFVR